jgi:hypothetical protein
MSCTAGCAAAGDGGGHDAHGQPAVLYRAAGQAITRRRVQPLPMGVNLVNRPRCLHVAAVSCLAQSAPADDSRLAGDSAGNDWSPLRSTGRCISARRRFHREAPIPATRAAPLPIPCSGRPWMQAIRAIRRRRSRGRHLLSTGCSWRRRTARGSRGTFQFALLSGNAGYAGVVTCGSDGSRTGWHTFSRAGEGGSAGAGGK